MSNFTAQDIIFGLRFNKLVFTVPTLASEPIFSGNIATRTNAIFSFESSAPQDYEVDWGDGTFKEVTNSNVLGIADGEKTYTDGLTEHVIQITFSDPSLITSFRTVYTNIGVNYPINILKFTNLTSISHTLGAGVENFPNDLSSLSKLTIFKLESSTLPNIPESIFALNLIELSLNSSVNLSLAGSNVDRLGELQNTLEVLTLQDTGIENNTLPASLLECLKLRQLNLGRNPFTILPSILPDSLKILDVSSSQLDGNGEWTNFDRLVNIESLIFTGGNFSNTTFVENPPQSLSALTKLNYLRVKHTNTSNIDNFFNNWYAFIELNADKDDSALDQKFRGMTLQTDSAPKPTGVFQQPTGYVANVDNGSPASPLEKAWLIVNQYGGTITAPTV